MNKNSKRRALVQRKNAKENRPRNEGGKMVISCNAGKIAHSSSGHVSAAPGCERVYINEDVHGKKFSITRHEAIAGDARVYCRSKVGQRKAAERPSRGDY